MVTRRLKLNAEQVVAILRDPRKDRDVAEAYGVTQSMVCHIRTGAKRASVAPEIPRRRRYALGKSLAEVIRTYTKVDPATGCWVWQRSRREKGYGQLGHGGRTWHAHRAAYEAFVGPIPGDLCVLHRCDNPPCCNPEHLFLGDRADNAADMTAKGRKPVGDARWNTRLTDEQVRAIRADRRTEREIAEAYGIHSTLAGQIRRRQAWKHVT